MKRSTLQSKPETTRAWQDRSQARAREKAKTAEPREPIGARKGKRRSRAPLPLPAVDGSPATLHESVGEAVAFGRQADLCRRTMCAACYAQECWGLRIRLRWSNLPDVQPGALPSEPHHEPPIGRTRESDDDDTIPLCAGHHRALPGGLVARHYFDHDPSIFYEAVMIDDWTAVRDEMRRRAYPGVFTKSLAPMVGAKGDGVPTEENASVAGVSAAPAGDVGAQPAGAAVSRRTA